MGVATGAVAVAVVDLDVDAEVGVIVRRGGGMGSARLRLHVELVLAFEFGRDVVAEFVGPVKDVNDGTVGSLRRDFLSSLALPLLFPDRELLPGIGGSGFEYLCLASGVGGSGRTLFRGWSLWSMCARRFNPQLSSRLGLSISVAGIRAGGGHTTSMLRRSGSPSRRSVGMGL